MSTVYSCGLDMLKDPVVADSKILKLIEATMPMCLNIPRAKKHVSLILHKNRILATGTNNFKGHPIASSLGYRFAEQHSELNALLKCEKRKDLVLVNLRFNSQRLMRMSRPCSKCLPWCCAIFEDIYYTCPDGKVRLLNKSSIIDSYIPAFIRNL
jgi:hypothetical protein